MFSKEIHGSLVRTFKEDLKNYGIAKVETRLKIVSFKRDFTLSEKVILDSELKFLKQITRKRGGRDKKFEKRKPRRRAVSTSAKLGGKDQVNF